MREKVSLGRYKMVRTKTVIWRKLHKERTNVTKYSNVLQITLESIPIVRMKTVVMV